MRKWLAALIAAFAFAEAAQAEMICEAQVFHRFGEDRANFSDVLAACRPDHYCSAVVSLPDPSHQAAYLQQLRVARPSPGAPYEIEFTGVAPMPATPATPMLVRVGSVQTDISALQANAPQSLNVFRLAQAATPDLIDRMKRGRTLSWTYASERGPATATFSLRGLTAALAWIDCMAA